MLRTAEPYSPVAVAWCEEPMHVMVARLIRALWGLTEQMSLKDSALMYCLPLYEYALTADLPAAVKEDAMVSLAAHAELGASPRVE